MEYKKPPYHSKELVSHVVVEKRRMLLLFILPLVVEAAVLLKEVMILGLVIMTSQNNRTYALVMGRIRVKSRRG